jgi:uncharacterized protein YutE (UPF0331/DUF86 family)
MSRINNKIEEIEKYLQELNEILPQNFEEYISNFEKKAACERYFEKIMEATIDLAFLIIKNKGLKMPEDEESSFIFLSNEKIISEELARKLKEAKGMRNVIAHEYGRIDDNLVFESLTEQLEKDINEFISMIGGVIT